MSENGSSPLSRYQLPGKPIQDDFVLSLNGRSLTAGNKTDEICQLLDNHKNCIALCLQEVWSLDHIPTLPGFQKLYYKCRSTNKAGGVGFYISDKFKYTILDSPFIENVLESIAVKISVNPHKSMKLVNVYLRPNQKLDDLLPLISTLPVGGRNTMVVGDFNYNLMNSNNTKLVEKFNELGLASIVDQPTRIVHTTNGITKSCVDHVYTNIRGSESFILTTCKSISDHFAIACTVKSNWRTRKRKEIQIAMPHYKMINPYLISNNTLAQLIGSQYWRTTARKLSRNFLESLERQCCCAVLQQQKINVPSQSSHG